MIIRCIQEAHEYISDNNLPHKILYLTNKSQDGHSETLNIQNDRSYSKQEVVQFFAEIEIAKLSAFLSALALVMCIDI